MAPLLVHILDFFAYNFLMSCPIRMLLEGMIVYTWGKFSCIEIFMAPDWKSVPYSNRSFRPCVRPDLGGPHVVSRLQPKLTIQLLPYFQIALHICWPSAFQYLLSSNSLPVLRNTHFCVCLIWGEGPYIVSHLQPKLTIQILPSFQIALTRCWPSAFPYFPF